jgi:hypothetical protein
MTVQGLLGLQPAAGSRATPPQRCTSRELNDIAGATIHRITVQSPSTLIQKVDPEDRPLVRFAAQGCERLRQLATAGEERHNDGDELADRAIALIGQVPVHSSRLRAPRWIWRGPPCGPGRRLDGDPRERSVGRPLRRHPPSPAPGHSSTGRAPRPASWGARVVFLEPCQHIAFRAVDRNGGFVNGAGRPWHRRRFCTDVGLH